MAERQRISADMHDSIGASLAALLAYFTTENVNLADVKRRLGEILMELRFLVDSGETDDGDINLLLGNVRHRMGSGIELAGIGLRWQVAELPRIRGLTAHDALAIKLILMETLSNVLHHSRRKVATMTARHDTASVARRSSIWPTRALMAADSIRSGCQRRPRPVEHAPPRRPSSRPARGLTSAPRRDAAPRSDRAGRL